MASTVQKISPVEALWHVFTSSHFSYSPLSRGANEQGSVLKKGSCNRVGAWSVAGGGGKALMIYSTRFQPCPNVPQELNQLTKALTPAVCPVHVWSWQDILKRGGKNKNKNNNNNKKKTWGNRNESIYLWVHVILLEGHYLNPKQLITA